MHGINATHAPPPIFPRSYLSIYLSIYLLTCCIVALITEYVDLAPSGFVRPSFARRLALPLRRKAKASLALRTEATTAPP